MLRAASLQPGEVVPGSFVVTFVPSTTQRRSPVVSVSEQKRALGRRTVRFAYNQDARAASTRYGSNVAGFAPGKLINTLNHDGTAVTNGGTSFAAPYVAGLIASVCQAGGTACQTAANGDVHQAFKKAHGITGTVVNPDGTTLPAGTPSRFFVRNGW